jgi:hypothetical protein
MSGLERGLSVLGNVVSVITFVFAILGYVGLIEAKPFFETTFDGLADQRASILAYGAVCLLSSFFLATLFGRLVTEGKSTFVSALLLIGAHTFTVVWLAESMGLPVASEAYQSVFVVALLINFGFFLVKYWWFLAGFEDGEGFWTYAFSPKRQFRLLFFSFAHWIVIVAVVLVMFEPYATKASGA